jgi:hypothetical protein
MVALLLAALVLGDMEARQEIASFVALKPPIFGATPDISPERS